MNTSPLRRSAGLRAGASNDQTRRHNLSTLLAILQQEGAQSRAQLTAHTLLNRSTIADLVGELVELGLVVEGAPVGTNQVGRPSPMVHPSEDVLAIAVNPEVDAITVGLVGLRGRVLRRVRVPTATAPSLAEAVQISADVIRTLVADRPKGSRIVGVGAAVPGLVRAADGLVRFAPHLDWHEAPYAELLSAATGLPVAAANDASLGAIAERRYGAGRGVDDLVYLNGGASGIGGGIIADGEPFGGVDGYAGEWGHITVTGAVDGGDVLEDLVNQSRLLKILGLGPEEVDQLDAALQATTDPEVIAEIRQQQSLLGGAIRNAVHVLNPKLVILGGFLGSLYNANPEFLAERVSERALKAPMESARITAAGLGAELLLVGGAELAFEPVLSDPAGYAWPSVA